MTLTMRHTLWLINVLVLGLVVWTAVALGMTVLGRRLIEGLPANGPPPVEAVQRTSGRSLADYQAIVGANMFGAQAAPVETGGQNGAPVPTTAAASDADPDLRLRGTVEGDDLRMAILENVRTGQQDLYKTGDKIDGAQIVRVEGDKVTLSRNGRNVELPLFVDESAPPVRRDPGLDQDQEVFPPEQPDQGNVLSRQVAPGRYVINREELGRQMADLNQLLSSVVIQPNFVQGQARGLRVASVKNGSPAQLLGIQSGDVVLTVNEVPMASPEDMINMYQQVQQLESVTIGIERRGAPLTLTYDFR